MIRISRLVFLILVLSFIGFSQEKNDLRDRGLRGKVRQFNYYEIVPRPTTNQQYVTERSLSHICVFNRKGNLRAQFEFSRNGKDCFYEKTVYSYDQKNRKKTDAHYKSDTSESLCLNTAPLFQENQSENIDGKVSLVEKTIYEYDREGRTVREIIFDSKNSIIQQNNYSYNQRGKWTRYIIVQQKRRVYGSTDKFVKTIDSRMFYRDNGKTKETYRYEDDKLIQKQIDYSDKQKRVVRGELYKLVTDTQNNIVKEISSDRTKTFYYGNKELFSWTIYDNKGGLQTQLYILRENDNDVMRLEYNRRSYHEKINAASIEKSTHYLFDHAEPEVNKQLKYILKFDECVESPDWIPTLFETKFYKFDAHGNATKLTEVQHTHIKENKSEWIYEMDLIYYQ